MKNTILQTKSISFSIRIIRLYNFLCDDRKQFILAKQILRSGTAIGALIMEAEFAQSTPDFIHKFHISLKEANETRYWLILLKETDYLSLTEFESLLVDCEELIKILVSTIKTLKLKK